MKNKLTILIDTDKDEAVQIGKPSMPPPTKEEANKILIEDIACTCEALVVMILLAHKMGARKKDQELHTCIEHIRSGVLEGQETRYAAGEFSKNLKKRHNVDA